MNGTGDHLSGGAHDAGVLGSLVPAPLFDKSEQEISKPGLYVQQLYHFGIVVTRAFRRHSLARMRPL
jgi:hypothetical protein